MGNDTDAVSQREESVALVMGHAVCDAHIFAPGDFDAQIEGLTRGVLFLVEQKQRWERGEMQ